MKRANLLVIITMMLIFLFNIDAKAAVNFVNSGTGSGTIVYNGQRVHLNAGQTYIDNVLSVSVLPDITIIPDNGSYLNNLQTTILGILGLPITPVAIYSDNTNNGGNGSLFASGITASLLNLVVLNVNFNTVPAWTGNNIVPKVSADGNSYLIYRPAELAWLASQTSIGNTFSGKSIKLMNSLDLNGSSSAWTPIGNQTTSFQGTFEGNNNIISNMNVPTGYYVGLFGRCSGTSSISNLGIGANSSVTATIVGQDASAGGIVGFMEGGTINKCYNLGTINSNVSGGSSTAVAFVGGIIGQLKNTSSVQLNNSFNAGNINGYVNTTGSNSGSQSGGVIGFIYNKNTAGFTINNCYNTGNINGTGTVPITGGIIGRVYGNGTGSTVISNTYNAGNVINSVAASTGGILGIKDGTSSLTLTNCYYDKQMSLVTSGVGTGTDISSSNKLLTSQMTTSSGLTGFTAGTTLGTWVFTNGMYPRLATTENTVAGILSTLPVTLSSSPFETAQTVQSNFTVGSYSGATWSTNPTGTISISGSNATVTQPTDANKTINLNVSYSGSTRSIPILVLKTSLFSVTVTQPTNGTITVKSGSTTLNNGLNANIANGTVLTITYTPSSGYALQNYIINGVNQSSQFVVVSANTTITASFAIPNIWNGTSEDSSSNFGGGTGTQSDPWLIYTPEQLRHLAMTNNGEAPYTATDYSGKYFKLMNNLDLGGKNVTPSNWTPIGSASSQFKGNFNGNNLVLNNLYVNKTSDYVGLFGYIGANGSAQNLGITGTSSIQGGNYVGSITGYVASTGSISNCFSLATVNATANYAGGIAGASDGSISNCYNVNSIAAATNFAGGIVGNMTTNGTLANAYNLGKITCPGTSSGNIVGAAANASNITYCFYDKQMAPGKFGAGTVNSVTQVADIAGTSNMTTNAMLGTGITFGSPASWKTTTGLYPQLASMANSTNSTVNTWSYVSVAPIFLANNETVNAVGTNFTLFNTNVNWSSSNSGIVSISGANATIVNSGAISLTASSSTNANITKVIPITVANIFSGGGSGTSGSPYIINTLADLQKLQNFVNSNNPNFNANGVYYQLGANIDMANTAWTPIGNETTPFLAQFNGANNTLANLNVNTYNQDAGLFGAAGSGATIKNTGLVSGSVNITADASSTAKPLDAGALVGHVMTGATIDNSYNGGVNVSINVTGTTASNTAAGGIVGVNDGTIRNVYNIKDVSMNNNTVGGFSQAGGIAGINNSSITNSYNAGIISHAATSNNPANRSVGGVVGLNNSAASLTYSYDSGEVNGSAGQNIGAVVGQNASGAITNSFYDKQMATVGGVNGTDVAGATGELTTNMLNTGIFSPSSNWVFAAGLYPRLQGDDSNYNMSTSVSALVSAAPIMLVNANPYFELSNNISSDFTVNNSNNVSWASSNTGILTINSGSNAELMTAGNVVLTASAPNGASTISKDIQLIVNNDYVFIGSSTEDWYAAVNWQRDNVPGNTDNVIIDHELTITSSENITCNNMLIRSGSVILQEGGALTVGGILTSNATNKITIYNNAQKKNESGTPYSSTLIFKNTSNMPMATVIQTIQTYGSETGVTDNTYHLISIPIMETIPQGKGAGKVEHIFKGIFLDEYDEPSASWQRYNGIASTGTGHFFDVVPLRGYSVNHFTEGHQIIIPGTLYNSDATYTLSFTSNVIGGTQYGGLNLIGNPYAAPIDLTNLGTWLNGKPINGAIWVWSNKIGNYQVYPSNFSSTDVDLDGTVIAASQGFWVKTTAATQFTIPYSAVKSDNHPLYKSQASVPYVKLKVRGTIYEDNMIVAQLDNCTSAFEDGWDGEKWIGLDNAPQLYAMENANILSIDAKNDISETLIGFRPGNEKLYTISLANISENLASLSITLLDLKTGIYHDLNKGDYTFSSLKNDNVKRFKLLINRNTEGIDENSDVSTIWGYDQTIFVKNSSMKNRLIEVMDVNGRIIKSIASPDEVVTIKLDKNGIYIVRIGSKTAKIVL